MKTERSIDDIFADRWENRPWPGIQQTAVDQVRERLAPSAAVAPKGVAAVKLAQKEGVACLQKYINRHLEILPIEFSELSGLCSDQLAVVESALIQYENLSIADAADSVGRFPVDVSMLEATANKIEGDLGRWRGRDIRIRRLVAQLETAMNELAESPAAEAPSATVLIVAKDQGRPLSSNLRFDARKQFGE